MRWWKGFYGLAILVALLWPRPVGAASPAPFWPYASFVTADGTDLCGPKNTLRRPDGCPAYLPASRKARAEFLRSQLPDPLPQLNVEPLEGLSLYADASHEAGSLAWYPGRDPTGRYTVMSQSQRGKSRILTFLATGARYAFENGNDWRVEYLFQEAGWTRDERSRARRALKPS